VFNKKKLWKMIRMQNGMLVPDSPVNRMARMAGGAFGVDGGGPTPPPTPTDGPMYFEAVEANSTVSLMSMLTTAPNLEYSTDGVTWQEWQHTTADGTHTFDTLTLTDVGDRVYLRGDNPNGFLDIQTQKLSVFSMSGKIAANGNAQSLVDGVTPTLVAKTMPLFSDSIITQQMSDVLVSAPSLPATTLSLGCYFIMFSGCAGLTTAPELPATMLADNCYMQMFSGCSGLTSAPALPATTLASKCYSYMFRGCTGLTSAPVLKVTTLVDGCYEGMFRDCTSLAAAPALPATTLADYCYDMMFEHCTFNMSDDGTTLNFEFGATLPVISDGITYSTYYEIAQWMGNTNGFTTP
jgi:hypothetical protein